ncbi:HEPN domain-containing protein [Hydrogenispora ethanolica]|uniref:HEPN domain-containing protein n=1 Tax=Hydrogenispora ethanolica TaxID=1082276 RepID=A0A4R1QU55_HYDET|nr:HEPN domain-containing protein [Hydrogenispora ethanolica]TCL56045.1 HEPN domain-containing protein [Hydrogenispora ethanolica]
MTQDVNVMPKKWIIKAENDLKTADQLLKMDEPITDSICFHCQQAAEKYLKAYLTHQGIPPEKTHKIERLIEAASQIDTSFVNLKAM